MIKNSWGFTLHPFLIYGHCKNQIPNTVPEACYNCSSAKTSQSHFSSSSKSQYRPVWKPLCLPIPNSLLFSSKLSHFHTEQTAIWWATQNFGQSSVSHSFHTMSVLSNNLLFVAQGGHGSRSESLNECSLFISECSRLVLIHDTEPWLTGSLPDCDLSSYSAFKRKRELHSHFCLDKVQQHTGWWKYMC